jgi:hypothetical protein
MLCFLQRRQIHQVQVSEDSPSVDLVGVFFAVAAFFTAAITKMISLYFIDKLVDPNFIMVNNLFYV